MKDKKKEKSELKTLMPTIKVEKREESRVAGVTDGVWIIPHPLLISLKVNSCCTNK